MRRSDEDDGLLKNIQLGLGLIGGTNSDPGTRKSSMYEIKATNKD